MRIVSMLLLGLYAFGVSPCVIAYGGTESLTIKITHSHEHGHENHHHVHHHNHEKSENLNVSTDSSEPESSDSSTHSHEVMVFSCSAVCYITGVEQSALYLPQPTKIKSFSVSHRLVNLLRLSSIFRPPIA